MFEVEGNQSHLDGVVIGQGGSKKDWKLQNEVLTILSRSNKGFNKCMVYPTKDWDHCIRVEYL